MTIAQALKLKNKKVALLHTLWDRLNKNNSVLEGNRRSYDPVELLTQIETEIEALVDLKTRIHNASAPVRREIFLMSELKNKALKLKFLNTSEGPVHDKYDGTVTRRIAVLPTEQIDSLTEATQQEIDSLQELLDKFNYSTQI